MDKQQRIIEIKTELRYLEQHRSFLQELQFQLHDLEKLKKEKEAILFKENQDVENLKRTTVLSLFHTLIGNKAKQLNKEKQEAMEASVNYHAICNEYDLKKQEVEELQKRFSHEQDLIQEFQNLCINENNQEMKDYKKKRDALHYQFKELEETLHAASVVEDSIQKAQKYYDEALDLGLLDMNDGHQKDMVDYIVSLGKYERLDQAMYVMQQLRMKLLLFERELKDFQIQDVFVPDIQSWLQWFDVFEISQIPDYINQMKIRESYDVLENLRREIVQTKTQFNQKKEDIKHKIWILEEQFQQFL